MERKKLLAFAFLCLLCPLVGKAQIRLFIDAPASVAREITSFSKPTNDGSWGFGNIDTVRVRTGPASCVTSDSLACTPLPAGSLTGKIAIIHRGDCDFGCKVQACQNAGAIGVVMINNQPGVLGMLGNTCGPSVTIPVVLIDQIEGNAIKKALCDSGVITIGTYRNVFNNNIGFDKDTGAVSPPAAAMPAGFINDTARFRFFPGVAVENYGRDVQQNVQLKAVINRIYSPSQPFPQTIWSDSTVITRLAKADDANSTAEAFFREFDLFNAVPSGDRQGIYEVVYTATMGNADDRMEDNTVRYEFRITDRYFSLAPLDPVTNDFMRYTGTSPSVASVPPTNRVFKWGPVMETPAGVAVNMDSVRLAVNAGDSVDFTALQINIEVHKWDDADANGAITETELTQVGNGIMSFNSDAEKGMFKSVGIDDALTGNPGPIALTPNSRYLILAVYRGDDIVEFSSEDSRFPYTRYFNSQAPRVISPVFMNQWFSGFTDSPVPAFRIDLSGAVTAARPGVSQLPVALYPNPAREYVEVAMDKGMSAKARIEVLDLNGRTLPVKAVPTANGVRISTVDLQNGVYQVVVRAAEGAAIRKFTVVR